MDRVEHQSPLYSMTRNIALLKYIKMKLLIATLLTCMALRGTCQKLSYSDGSVEFDNSTVRTIDVTLSPKVETIKDKFEDWMDDNYDVDLDDKKLLFFTKDYMTANGVVIPQISQNRIDLKVKVDETNGGNTKLNVFASFGYNNWITEDKHPFEYAALRGIVYDFVSEYLPEYYLDRVKESESTIAKLNDRREDMEDDIKDNEKSIRELREDNKNLMKKIRANELKIKEAKKRLTKQTNEYKEVKKKVTKM